MSTEALTQPVAEPAETPAIVRCNQAWKHAWHTATERRADTFTVRCLANKAYRDAMPTLLGHSNIRDFIACIAQGILVGAIEPIESSKLLYAAQVALGALRPRAAPAKPKAA